MGNKPCANGTRIYINCEGLIDKVIGRVEEAGGKIIVPKSQIGGDMWYALITDIKGILSAYIEVHKKL